MASNQKFRQQSKLKTTLRVTLIEVAASIAGLLVLLIIVFNMTQQEEGRAARTSMTFKNAETVQDTTTILRGSTNQRIIGVMVDISGKGTPIKINSILFSAKGTSLPINQNVENAKLWFTGNDNGFTTTQQVGSTVSKITEKNFEFDCSQLVTSGKNYFWLTFDIKPDAVTGPGMIDATCEEITIGAISYKPLISAPNGKRFTQANIAYYSMGNYAVNNLSAWNSKRDGTGQAPKQLSASRNSFFIQAGHRMISSTGSSLQTLVVERGGELRITAPLRLNTMYVACGGTVLEDVTVNDYYCFNEFIMDNGSNYIHNNTGYLPGLNCKFDPRSNQTFFQYGKATFPYDVKWGNVIIDATTPIDLDIQRYFKFVQGDLEIKRTGLSENGLYSGGNDTMFIAGNLIMSGGNFIGIKSNEDEKILIKVGHDFILKGGNFQDVASEKSLGSSELKVEGDVMLFVGNFNYSGNKKSKITFSGKGTSRWMQKPTCNSLLGNVDVTNSRQLYIKGDKFGEIGAGFTLNVGNSGELYCENAIVSGKGTFELNELGTLGIGHPDGIFSNDEKGNIRTAERIFNSGATYFYYTESQPQQTGSFKTQPLENKVRCLMLDKGKSSNYVSLSQNLTVTEKVMFNKGDIKQGEFDLVLPRMSAKN